MTVKGRSPLKMLFQVTDVLSDGRDLMLPIESNERSLLFSFFVTHNLSALKCGDLSDGEAACKRHRGSDNMRFGQRNDKPPAALLVCLVALHDHIGVAPDKNKHSFRLAG